MAMGMATTTNGSADPACPRGPRNHCSVRLRDRYNLPSLETATKLYEKHHSMLVKGSGALLYGSKISGYVFRLRHRGRYWYPVRRWSEVDGCFVTVTYLAPHMVLESVLRLVSLPVDGDGETEVSDDEASYTPDDDDSWLEGE